MLLSLVGHFICFWYFGSFWVRYVRILDNDEQGVWVFFLHVYHLVSQMHAGAGHAEEMQRLECKQFSPQCASQLLCGTDRVCGN